MTEHAWSQEQIAAYLAGGLTSEEAERLDQHARECPDCRAALAAAKHFDRGLGTLFAPLRPKPGLEDRAIQAFRAAPPRVIFFLGWPRRITAAAAAIIAMATFGALAASIMADGRLPMPGEDRKVASGRTMREAEAAQSPPARFYSSTKAFNETLNNLTIEDPGLESNVNGAIPDLNRFAEKTVDDIVTNDPIGVRDRDARTEERAENKRSEKSKDEAPTTSNTTSFNGRSGATKSQVLNNGGGNGGKPPDADGPMQTWSYNGPLPPGQNSY
ncbi:MAG TPA: zf-HC2 domain-containing protein, partial [Urbifossiella sp.]